MWGVFAVLLADLSRSLGLSPGPLGLALFVGAAASIGTMALLGWASDRAGRRTFLVAVSCAVGAGIAGLAFSGGFASLLAALVVLYSASGLYDVGINAVAVDLEQSEEAGGRRLMPFLHAAFSGGAAFGAVAAGALREAGVDHRLVYLSLLVPLAVVISAFATTRFAGPDGPTDDPPGAPRRGRAPQKGKAGRWGLYRNGPLLLLAAISTLALLAEGEMEHWSGIYLRDSLGLTALLGGSGVAVFFGAMALGRLCVSFVVGRVGARRTVLAAGLFAAVGMAAALATTRPILVVGGFLVVGLALAAVAPLAFSLAGDLVPGRAGAAISVVTTFGYGGFLLGPPIVGGLAEAVGLRSALWVIALAGALIFVLALRLKAP